MDDKKRLIKVLAHHVVYNGMPLKVAVNILNQHKDEVDNNQPDQRTQHRSNRNTASNYINSGLLAFG